MKLGFIGTGAITEALVIGLMRDPPDDFFVHVSPRGADVAAKLSERFPKSVKVAVSNQAVVDASDTLVLAVRPQVARDVLAALAFREDQTVVSVIAMMPLEDVAALVFPATDVSRAIPLPSAAEGLSPTVLMPPHPDIASLLGRVGRVTEVSDATAFDALAAASGIMATHFAMAEAVAAWLEEQGVSRVEARAYVGQILFGMARTADASPEKLFGALVREHETAGGLNEQLRHHMASHGALDALTAGLGLLHRRIRDGG